MRKAMTTAGLAVAAMLALAGCVGIPTSGGVQTGPVIDDQLKPEVVVVPAGPRAGATQDEILTDFMQAVRGPQNDYATAREFLSKALSGTWEPDASALIRSSAATVGPGPTEDSLNYTVTSKAYVDADGRYFEQPQASQTLQFGFTKENGEWRISQAPNGIVLSQSSFNIVFTEQPLYFFDPSNAYLVPDVRWFPSRSTVPVRIVSALLAGPASWLGQGVLSSAFPIATTLGAKTVAVVAGTATVDLSKEALTATPQQRALMRRELAATLGAADVIMTVGGIELATPDASGTGGVVDPLVEAAVLIGTGTDFGFDGGDGVTPIDGLTPKLIAAGAVTATLTEDKQSAAFLGADGVAYVARIGSDPAHAVDSRGGLVAPTIDPFRFAWSAQASSAASLATYEVDGTEHPIQSGLPADARIVSMELSRDGARLLLYMSTPLGPRLVVAGIIRGQGNVPTALGVLLDLPVPGGQPVDAAWVDDRSVAVVSSVGDAAPVTLFEIGGSSTQLPQLPDAVSITGGNGASDGLRVLSSTGEIWRLAGSGGWVNTGIKATFLGTKQ